MVAPGVGAGAAPGVGLAGDGGDGAIGHAAGEGLIGDLEGDALSGLPEAGSELVGEEESVVTPLGAEGLDRLASGLPGQADPGGVPLAEVEAVGAGLGDEQMEQFKAGHKGPIPGVKSDLPGRKNGSMNRIETYLRLSCQIANS